MNRRGPHVCGYTLVEVLIASALVGVVLAGALDGMGGAARTWLAAGEAVDADALARQLLDEVLAQSYSEPDYEDADAAPWGIDAGETAYDRGTFDDLDDYDDWSASPPVTRAGATIDGYSGWSRSVVVRKLKKRKVNDFRDDGDDDHGSRQVTVTVSDGAGQSLTLEAVRANRGGAEQALGVTNEFVTGVEVLLKPSGSDPVFMATQLLNHAEGP